MTDSEADVRQVCFTFLQLLAPLYVPNVFNDDADLLGIRIAHLDS